MNGINNKIDGSDGIKKDIENINTSLNWKQDTTTTSSRGVCYYIMPSGCRLHPTDWANTTMYQRWIGDGRYPSFNQCKAQPQNLNSYCGTLDAITKWVDSDGNDTYFKWCVDICVKL